MSLKWYNGFIGNLKDGAGELIKDEIKGLVNTAKDDAESFIKEQGEKLERYLDQLTNGLITKKQFEGYVFDMKSLTEMESLKMKVAAKARAQNLAEGIKKLIIDGLLTLI